MLHRALRWPDQIVRSLRLPASSAWSSLSVSRAFSSTVQGTAPIESTQSIPSTTTAATAGQPKSTPAVDGATAGTAGSSKQSASPLRYFIGRTKSKNLPVYEETARGGNLKRTRIGKIDGDAKQLVETLKQQFGIADTDVEIRASNNHVLMRGWRKKEIEDFLKSQSF